jgi:molecular chaperone IbpA
MTGNLFPKTAFIGFDHILSELQQITNNAKDVYPPHNIVKYDDKNFEIELAIAGFVQSDLTIELKDNVLTVKGDRPARRPETQYVHRGISTRKFAKSFRLSEYTEVTGASLHDGILSIGLAVKLPEEKSPVLIKIQNDNRSTGK